VKDLLIILLGIVLFLVFLAFSRTPGSAKASSEDKTLDAGNKPDQG
jgi:hypothetical protein